MKHNYSILFVLLLSTFTSFSQKGSIEGSIIDASSRIPLIGASINLSGDKGDNSDMFGNFSIPAVNPGQYEMVISHIIKQKLFR